MRPTKVRVRSDLKKTQSFINRNWPKASIAIREKAEARAAERLAAQAAREARLAKKMANKVQLINLERVPEKDFMDFSTEEQGYFRLGDKIVQTVFPR